MIIRRIGWTFAQVAILSGCDQGAAPVPGTAPRQVEPATRAEQAGTAGMVKEAAPKPHPCLMQGAEAIEPARLRGIGTEPFWGVKVEGRCVTYSDPEVLQGFRIWTKFVGTAHQGVWTGIYKGKGFVLRSAPADGCSDGMSDERYPIALRLTIGNEERHGCAKRL